jgi:hypothetical protein
MFEQKSPKEASKRPAGREDSFELTVCQLIGRIAGKIHVSVRRSHQREHRIQPKRVENLPPLRSNLGQNKPAQRNRKDLTA